MYAEIHSKSETNDDSPGKTQWINVNDFQIGLASSSPQHLNCPPWHIVLNASMTDVKSTGEQGTLMHATYRATIRTLEIQLTPSDLSRLLEFAGAKGLLAVSAKT